MIACYRKLWARISRGEVYRAIPFMATGRDVSDRIRTIDRLKHAATHDPLTDLPNRSLFMDRLGQVLKRAARRGDGFALAIADIDRFKAINDRLGHTVGDSVLQAVAQAWHGGYPARLSVGRAARR